MDGVHDMGGKQGFGPVRHEAKAVFKPGWEPRANALYSLGVRLGLVNMDEYRHAIERMEPRHYLSASYYERSLTGFATLCVEKGVVTHEELEKLAGGAFPLSLPSAEGRHNAMPRESFMIGDRVRVKNEFVSGHVRMPGYIRGKTGVVASESPPYPFPDAAAHNLQARDEPTYDVQFRTEDLWPQASDSALVHVGVFESYLEKAPQKSAR
jgi:nitrile hydratase subunit beta